jgi:hypothetical protein
MVACLRGEGTWIASPFLAGKALNELLLAQTLRPYGIRPVAIRIGEKVNKGYRVDDFKSCLRRYVPRMDIDARIEEIEANSRLRQEAAAEEADRLKRGTTAKEELAGVLAGAAKA